MSGGRNAFYRLQALNEFGLNFHTCIADASYQVISHTGCLRQRNDFDRITLVMRAQYEIVTGGLDITDA
jgi:hypothetical protein